jgi:hypothetical protein
MIIASQINHYKKGDEIREIVVEILQPILKDEVWECTLIMRGYGEVNQNMFGHSSIQALSFALQHAKFNLELMINDGYNYYDKEENRELSNAESIELLDVVYGGRTLLDELGNKNNL